MSFANPWGLLALFALPAIAAIHLFHRRFPRLEVAGLHLWGLADQSRTPGRRRERLPLTTTLVLELLAALLLALGLAQPGWDRTGGAVHLVVVLDGSASMSARAISGPPAAGERRPGTFRDAAVAEVRSRLADLPRGSALTIIESGRRPVLLLGPKADPDDADDVLDTWQPAAPNHDPHPAWDLADQLAEQSGRLLAVSDRLPDPGEAAAAAVPARLEIISVGSAQPNLAITTARWTLDDNGTGKLFLRITNFSRRSTAVRIVGRAGDLTVLDRTLDIPGDHAVPHTADLPGGLGQLDISLASPADALELDSRVRLIEPLARLVSVAVTLPEDSPARRHVLRALAALPGWQPATFDDADLVVAAADQPPPQRPGTWWLGIGPLDASEAARKKAVDLSDRSAYLLEKRDPLLEGVVLAGVVWGGVQPMPGDVSPLVSAGRHALLARRRGQAAAGTVEYLLNIDLARSNLPDTPDWPILVSNLLELCRDSRPGLRRFNYRVGEPVRFGLDPAAVVEEDRVLELRGGRRTRPLVRGPVVEIPPLEETGVFTIVDGDQELGRFAVNFHDPAESILLGLQAGRREAAVVTDLTGFRVDSAWSWLIAAGILAVLAAAMTNWQILQRPTGTAGGQQGTTARFNLP